MWTPTFPLLRERTVWLSACAARSAIAFGESVVDEYLHALSSAAHPMKAFDALFGLAAIALSDPTVAQSIVSEIRSLKAALYDRDVPNVEYYERAYDDALSAISGSGDAQVFGSTSQSLGWREKSAQGLATPAALLADPTSMTGSRRFLGFMVLPTIVAMPPNSYYPQAAGTRRKLRIAEPRMAQVLSRAWGPSPLPSGRLLPI